MKQNVIKIIQLRQKHKNTPQQTNKNPKDSGDKLCKYVLNFHPSSSLYATDIKQLIGQGWWRFYFSISRTRTSWNNSWPAIDEPRGIPRLKNNPWTVIFHGKSPNRQLAALSPVFSRFLYLCETKLRQTWDGGFVAVTLYSSSIVYLHHTEEAKDKLTN